MKSSLTAQVCLLLGDKGKQYIHYVIGHCSNYDFHRTARWFNRIPDSPISCPRIREWLSDITPGVGCYCEFNLPKGGYPSPLLYANPEATKQMGMKKELPIIQQKPVDVYEKIVLPQEPIDEIVKRYMEIKRHKRKVDLEVHECEDRLNSLLETKGTDSILTEFGKLVRVRKEDKTIFAIEI